MGAMKMIAPGAFLLALSLSACGAKQTELVTSRPSTFVQKKAGDFSPTSVLDQARKAQAQGEFERALSLYEKAELKTRDPAARIELLVELGRFDAALGALESWLAEGGSASAPGRRQELLYLRALVGAQQGQVKEALDQLRSTAIGSLFASSKQACPDQATAGASSWTSRALLLGVELHLQVGDRARAEEVAELLLRCAPTAAHPPAHLVYAGQAAALIRRHELANELFNQAETGLDEKNYEREHRDLLVYRGALFLEKHDAAQAGEIAEELSTRWPHDLRVRLYGAQMSADTRFDFARAEDEARALLEENPRHQGALFILAGIELRDMNLSAAQAWVDKGLEANPRSIDLLSMQAAVLFLSEDKKGFDAQMERLQELSPQNVRPYLVVAEFAEWEHRYPEIEKMMRRASRLDRQAAEVRSRLGLTLVRAGSDAAGVVELNRAYDLDPYNLRVINTLNLYEKIIARDYVSVRKGPFRFRFPKKEAELLNRYVPALMEQGYAEMKQRYNYTPPSPIDVELYEERSQFAVRTSGVPSIGIQGVCFGHKLATVSPIGSPGNLGMTLWHELGHVFHIGLSGFRVPRYLTEGLAEWETLRRKVGWSRELDRELYEVRQSDALPPLSQMSRAFTHARRAQDVAAAYYASGILSEWLVHRFGESKTVELLAQMGRGQVPGAVIPQVLGQTWQQLDQAFSAHLDQKLSRLEGQFVPLGARDESLELRPLIKKDPKDEDLQLRLALALLAEGELKEARPLLEKLHDRDNPQAIFALVRLALADEDKDHARELLDELFDAQQDGYELRMLSARLYFAAKEEAEAIDELKRALSFEQDDEDVRKMLVKYYHRKAQPKEELEQVRAWARLSEHDPFVHRRYLELLIEQDQIEEAQDAAALAIWVDLAGVETHRLAGLAYSRARKWKEAEFEWQSALLCPAAPEQLIKLGQTWSEELKKAGRGAEARRIDQLIGSRVEALLKEKMSQQLSGEHPQEASP